MDAHRQTRSMKMGLPRRLEIVRHISTGLHKVVYEAFDSTRRQRVALYCFHRGEASVSSLERLQELHALTRIPSHPNILPLIEVVESENHVVLSVPFMPRGDLGTRIAKALPGNISIRECLSVGLQIASAIGHVHRHGIIHGDVKAGNILLGDDDLVLLADFDFAHKRERLSSNTICGTLTHLAPEWIQGEPSDERSDLYSLGCLLYHLMTGQTPFSAQSPAELLHLHLTATPIASYERNSEIPISVSEIIDRLLEKRPEDRPQSAFEVRTALEAALRTINFCESGSPGIRPLPSQRSADDELDHLVADAMAARSRFVVLTGELGLGKSEALRRLARRSQEKGLRVCVGLPGDRPGVPYLPVINALANLSADLAVLHSDMARVLRSFLYVGNEVQSEPGGGSHGSRARLFATIFLALQEISRRRPILLLFDDLETFDDASLEFILYLEFALRSHSENGGANIILVASCDPDASSERLGPLLEQAAAIGCRHRIVLHHLAWYDIPHLCRSLRISPCNRAISEEIALVCQGNTLVALDNLRRMIPPAARDSEEAWSRVYIPHDVRASVSNVGQVLERRISICSEVCKAVLELTAIVGLEVSIDIARRVASALDVDLESGLREACKIDVLVDRGDVFAFRHPLARAQILQEIEPERAAFVHLLCVDALLSSEVDSVDIRNMEVARHLLEAGTKSVDENVTRRLFRAGQHAMSRFAWSDAIRYLDGALGTLQESFCDAETACIHHQLGLAYLQLFDAQPCMHHMELAIGFAKELDDVEILARLFVDRAHAINRMGLSGGDLSEQSTRDLCQVRQMISSDDSAFHSEILAVLAESAWVANHASEAETLALQAMESASPEFDDALRAETSVVLGLSQLSLLKHKEALSTWYVGARHGRRAKNITATARCLQRAQLGLFVSGRLREVERLSREVESMNRVVRIPAEAALTSAVRAGIGVLKGNLELAETEFLVCVEQLARAQYPWGLALITPTIACARALAGNAAGAWSALEQLSANQAALMSQDDLARVVERHRALVDYFVGEPIVFPRECRDALKTQLGAGRLNEVTVYQACVALEIAQAQHDKDLASCALPIVEAAVEREWVLTTGWPFFLPRLAAVGRLLIGDVKVGIQQLRESLNSSLLRELPVETGRVRLDLARALALSLDSTVQYEAVELADAAANALRAFPRCVFHERAADLARYIESNA